MSRRFNSRCSHAQPQDGDGIEPFAVVVPEYRVRWNRTTGAGLLATPTDPDLCEDGSNTRYVAGSIKRVRTRFLSSLLASLVKEGGSALPNAENAYDCLLAFLRVMDVLPATPTLTPTTHYLVQGAITKTADRTYRVHVNNFEHVTEGEVFATTSAGDQLVADNDFWPVLMSTDGHDTLLGYRSTQLGDLNETTS